MRRGPVGVLLLVAAAAVAAYLPAVRAGLVIDDVPILGANPVLERGNVREILTTGWWSAVGNQEAALHRPVAMLSFLPDRAVGGGVRPARAHVVNLLVHALASAALAALLLRLGAGRAAAGAAGLLFAVHPIHVSAVVPLVGRADLLAGAFTLLALVAHTWAGPERGIRPRLASWGTGLGVFLAAGSKEIAIAAPALLVAYDLLYRPPERGRFRAWLVDRLACWAPSIAAVVVFMMLRTAAIEAFPGGARVPHFANPLAAMEGADRLRTALGLPARYLALLVWPAAPAADYSGAMVFAERSWLAWRPLLGAGILVALLATAARRSSPWALASALILVPYGVVGNLVFLIGTIMAERLVYLPSAGAAALAGVALARVAGRSAAARGAIGGALLVAVATLAGLSWRESGIWQSDATIWEAELRRHPESVTAQFIEGQRLHRLGRLAEAEARFDTVLALWPESSAAMYEKGVLAARRRDLAAAESWFRRSVRINPWNADARADLGIAIRRRGRGPEAERHLRWALADFPGMEKPNSELAELLFESGRYVEALRYYRVAIALGRADLRTRAEEARRLASGS